MKPVLIQTLIKNKKKPHRREPVVEQEIEQYRNRSADFVLWFLVFVFVTGLLLS